MPRRLIDEREVVTVVLHLRAADDDVAELGEDPPDLGCREAHRVEPAAPQRRGRSGQVERLLATLVEARQLLTALIDRIADAPDELVDRLPELAPRLRVGDTPDAAQQRG